MRLLSKTALAAAWRKAMGPLDFDGRWIETKLPQLASSNVAISHKPWACQQQYHGRKEPPWQGFLTVVSAGRSSIKPAWTTWGQRDSSSQAVFCLFLQNRGSIFDLRKGNDRPFFWCWSGQVERFMWRSMFNIFFLIWRSHLLKLYREEWRASLWELYVV